MRAACSVARLLLLRLLQVTGSYFSSAAFVQAFISFDSAIIIPALVHTDTMLVFAAPPGDGAVHSVAVIIASRVSNLVVLGGSAASSAGIPNANGANVTSFPDPFYMQPSVSGITPKQGPTSGGTLITIVGSNFGRELQATRT